VSTALTAAESVERPVC